MVRFKLTARKILREELLKVVSLYYITLFICKFLYWLPVGLVINTCTCPYTLFVFLKERKTGMKQPHQKIHASHPGKGADGAVGGDGGRRGSG